MSDPHMTLEQWRQNEGLTYSQLATLLGLKDGSSARRYCLPSDHKDHRYPRSADLRRRIANLTEGRVIFE